jgi:nucleotide-binding universal stress UspA family protein
MPKIIVAYDGTPHADDALAFASSLGELLGAELALAHVHRADPGDRSPSAKVHGREDFLRRQGEAVLSRASAPAGGLTVSRHAIAGTTTASALRELADREHAELIVFGSAYDGPPGRVHPGSAARRLLQSAGSAIAIAPDGFRERTPSESLAVSYAQDDAHGSARRTAKALAAHAAGTAREDAEAEGDVLVLGSSAGAPSGRVKTSATSDRLIQAARVPVIVLPEGATVAVGGAAGGVQAA